MTFIPSCRVGAWLVNIITKKLHLTLDGTDNHNYYHVSEHSELHIIVIDSLMIKYRAKGY